MRNLLLAVGITLALSISGCIDQDDAPQTTEGDGEDPAAIILGPVTEELTGNTGNAAGTPVLNVNNGDGYEFPMDRSSGNVTGFVLELEWDANGPESESLDIWIRQVGDYAIPPTDPAALTNNQPHIKTTGTSPLRLVVAESDLDADTEYSILIRAATPAGAALEQAFTLHKTVFDGVELDSEHSALE